MLKALAGGALAVGAVSGATRLWPRSDDADRGGRPGLALVAEDAAAMSSLELPLNGRVMERTGSGDWESAALSSSEYSMVAFTWPDPHASPSLHVRSRSRGRWGEWRVMPRLHDAPDPNTGERSSVAGTELVWIGLSDGIQVRLRSRRLDGLTLLLLHPWRRPEDDLTLAGSRAPSTTLGAAAEEARVPRPLLLGRRQWGADESWRSGDPRYVDTIEQVHVHHTVNSNAYAEADVPALIRGMYRYHTHYLGWSDIAYNFLVDRFGRVWIGRAGGARRPVRGAHTLGFNATSVGVAAIGNFELVAPSEPVIQAIAAVAAWKLDTYGRDPLATTAVTSEGSDKFRRSQVVTLPVVDGHRDTNDTACPGKLLYARLPDVRSAARSVIDQYSSVIIVQPASLSGVPALGQALTVIPGVYAPADVRVGFVWLRDGAEIPGAIGPEYTVGPADVGCVLGVRVTASKGTLQPASATMTAASPVRARAALMIRAARARPGRLRLLIETLSPSGVGRLPTGQVVVRVNDRRGVVQLVDGRGTVTFGRSSPFKSGPYQVRATYRGDVAFDRARVEIRARVS